MLIVNFAFQPPWVLGAPYIVPGIGEREGGPVEIAS
jgi:hypothetical protein